MSHLKFFAFRCSVYFFKLNKIGMKKMLIFIVFIFFHQVMNAQSKKELKHLNSIEMKQKEARTYQRLDSIRRVKRNALMVAHRRKVDSMRIIHHHLNLMEKEKSKQDRISNWSQFRKLKKNIVYISPFTTLCPEVLFGDISDYFMIGASYERSLNPYLSFELPFSFGRLNNVKSIGLQGNVYPYGLTNFIFGVSLLFNFSKEQAFDYFYTSNGFTEYEEGIRYNQALYSRLILGYNINKHIVIKADVGAGFEYWTQVKFKQDESLNIHYSKYRLQYVQRYSNLLVNFKLGFRI